MTTLAIERGYPERVTTLAIEAIRYEDGVLHVLDQTRLPAEEVWLELRDAVSVAEAIASLRVRGAPLIGIAAAYGLAAVERHGGDVGTAAALIRAARPTAVNLARAVDRVLAAPSIETEARAIHRFEVEACEAIGRNGAPLVPPGARVLTHCNTGHLATGGIGTALGVVRCAEVSHVWVTETRPLRQGARLTAWELRRLGLPFSVVADTAPGALFARGEVDVVLVGADRIAANGDTANKVGTYQLAVLAGRHGVPLYVAAPTTTIDAACPSGSHIEIEVRPADEIEPGATGFNPAFDVTPAELVTSFVTETGVHRPPYRFSL